MIQETIKNFLQQHHISRDAGFILAVSGGADSICMLHAFKYLNLKMLVLHCNFSLRGKESDMDEQFVKRFCDSYGIAHSVKKFDTLKYARENGLSVEMAARELRYTWFREMKEKKKMDYIGRRPSCRRCCRNRFDQSLPGNRYKRANRYKIHQRRHPSSSAPMFSDRYTEIHRRPPIGVFGPIPPIIHWIMCVIKYATRSSRSSKKSILRFWIP